MADILGMMGYIQQQGEAGKRSGLSQLMGKAYNAPRDERQQILGTVAQRGGADMAYDAEAHFKGMDDNARQRLGQYAAAFDALPDDQKPMAYPQLAQQAQQLGIPAPSEWRPEYAPNISKLAQTLGGGGAGDSVQSRFVDQQGNVMALMRDGTVRPLGVQAENRLQLRDQPGIAPGAFDPRAGTIRPVGDAQAPQPGQITYATSDGQQIPQNEMPAFQAAMRADAQGRDFTIPVGQVPQSGAAAPRPAVAPAEQARLMLAAQANQRAEEASARAAEAARLAQRGNAPAGFRFKPDGSLEAIPGGPKPAGAAASEDERKAAAWLAQAGNAYQNMQSVLAKDPTADDPGIIESYSPFEEIGNRSRSDNRQQYVQAAESLSEALLRAATGAGINEHEARQKVNELTPKRGDSEAVKKQKLAAIPVYLAALKARAGRAVPQQPEAPTSGGGVDDLLSKYGVR